MTSTGTGAWLRPLTADPDRSGADPVVHPDRRLGELVTGRPPGITGHQWSSALREGFDQVVCDARTGLPAFALRIAPPAPSGSPRHRVERATTAVCAAVGLPVLTVESATPGAAGHSRRIIGYVLDARRYAGVVDVDGAGGDPDPASVGFRDIVGRLPDGRSGHVNDLGALARTAAVEAYVDRRLADPLVRGLHVRWRGGPAEGWSWVSVRPDRCLVERVRIWEHGVWSGVDAARLAEDLAAAALGERLRDLTGVTPELVTGDELRRSVVELNERSDELVDGFAFAHLCAD
ncbi:hypothetical protein [Micromonospora mirobrigensis]|uniref:DUF2726 domain-containing protein n=1 Tax=Micromonospora mirobrigensis TaxID=262898 RepID=A0A1C4WH07_9ACTN|nr:hypothetical protein [Micromonospora mirobrigensis]SCE95473.1 hypothetical protein GA0070564_102264 [Micromonospora mirobrigensis]